MLNNRQGNNNRRRGRNNNNQRPQGNNPGRNGDNGNRIDSRARGNAPQLLEKYKTLARDAQMQSDRVLTEYYLQFADHYFRVVAETRSRFEENQPRRPREEQRDEWDAQDQDDVNQGGEDYDAASDFEPVREPRLEDQDESLRAEQLNRDQRPFSNRPSSQVREESRDRTERRPRIGQKQSEERLPPAAVAPQSEAREMGLDLNVLPPSISQGASLEDTGNDAPPPKRRGRPKKSTPETEAA